jgi:lysozyme
MIPSQNCIDLIKGFEGCEYKPYLDEGSTPTIGYGSTYYLDGSPVKITDPPITEALATELLLAVLKGCGRGITPLITVKITQNEFDALCSFVYNLGLEALKTSTMLKLINDEDFTLAGLQFPLWDHIRKNGQLVADQGLLNRRLAEQKLFLS